MVALKDLKHTTSEIVTGLIWSQVPPHPHYAAWAAATREAVQAHVTRHGSSNPARGLLSTNTVQSTRQANYNEVVYDMPPGVKCHDIRSSQHIC